MGRSHTWKASRTRSPSLAAEVWALRLSLALGSLLMVALNAYFLYYLHELGRDGGRCSCALGWQRSFVQASLAFFVAWAVVAAWLWPSPALLASPWAHLVYVAATVAYLAVTRAFVHRIKSTGCECARSRAFRALDVWNWVQIGVLAAVVAAALVLLLLASTKT
jgi:hypothetical protein